MRLRATRAAILLFVTAVVAFLLAACHSGQPHGAAQATTGTTPSAAPAPSNPLAIPASAFAGHKPFTGPVVAKFGQASLEAAYREAVNFAFETGWNPTLMRKNHSHLAMADFANARTFMTPACVKSFNATLTKVFTGDKTAIAKLEQAMSFGVAAPGGLTLVPSGKIIADRRFSAPTATVDHTGGHDRVSMSFALKATLQLQNAAGARYNLLTTREARYWMVPNKGADHAQRPFLIDAWAIRVTPGRPTPAG